MSDGASVMTSAKGGEGARFRKDFASTIINMRYIHLGLPWHAQIEAILANPSLLLRNCGNSLKIHQIMG